MQQPTSKSTETYSSFEEYIRAIRFRDTQIVERVESEIKKCHARIPHSSGIVVIHTPFPESEATEQDSSTEEEQKSSLGQGSGKSDLLYLIQERVKERQDCSVIGFIGNHDKLVNGVDFYKDIFLDELAKSDRRLMHPAWHSLHVLGRTGLSLYGRISLILTVAAPIFGGVIAYTLSLLGFRALEFIVDPKNQPLLANIFALYQQYQGILFAFALVGLLVGITYAVGMIIRDNALAQKWESIGYSYSEAQQVSDLKEKLSVEQEQILKRFCKQGRTLVLLIDDVDLMDALSFERLLNLYDQASESQRWSVLFVLTFNPRNPTLYQFEKSRIRQALDPINIRDKQWTSIQLELPTPERMRTWLWGYYRHPRAVELMDILERNYPEACSNAGLVLSFFRGYFDKQLSAKDRIAEIDRERICQEFEKYLHRDRRIAQDIITAISESEHAEGCLEMLKYLLAFKRPRVRCEHLRSIMSRTRYKDVETYENVLLSEKINLLKKMYIDGNSTLVFRSPYLRSILETGWEQWRDNAARYYDEVFLGLHRFPRFKDDPVLALEAAPSKLAIDVLYWTGEYYYRYYGSSDAGYALRFYALEHGGALGKWWELCKDAMENQGDLWGLVHWKVEARINPYHLWSGQSPPAFTFAPDMILTAGHLYWMVGQWKTAETIWTDYWPQVRDRLSPAPTEELAKRLRTADAEIQASLAEMFYEVGEKGYWDRASALCISLLEQMPRESTVSQRARVVLALLRHYRSTGIGNELPPYRFLYPNVKLDNLESVYKSIPRLGIPKPRSGEKIGSGIDRLRVLHALAESLWQMLMPYQYPLPREIDLNKVGSVALDPDLLERFAQILKEEQDSLKEIHEYRRSQRKSTLPDGRAKEGDLLLYEGYFLLARARHFCIVALLEFAKYKNILASSKPSEVQQRFDTYYAIANLLNDFCVHNLLEAKPSTQFMDLFSKLEQIEMRFASLQASAKREEERKARNILSQLYTVGWNSILGQAREKFRFAETIYQRLSHQQGIAAATFGMALAEREFSAQTLFGDRPAWVDTFERFFRWNSEEMGYHLDNLRAHIAIAQWAWSHDLYRAVKEFQCAEAWAISERLGLPKAIAGEIFFQIGSLIGNMESAPFSDDYVLSAFDQAAKYLDALGDSLPYINDREIADRRITIHWWLAELSRRKAESEKDPALREKHLKRVISECNYVINRSRGDAERATSENLARLVRGRALASRGEVYEGFLEIEKALEHFVGKDLFHTLQTLDKSSRVDDIVPMLEKSKEPFHALQALTALLNLAIQGSKDPNWSKCVDRCSRRYFPALKQLAGEYLSRQEMLGTVERLALYRACRLLGSLLANAKMYDQALVWLNATFSLLESLQLFGEAILLDHIIRPVYEALGDVNGLEEHRRRVIEAGQRLDPTREEIPFSLIGPILRRYAHLTFAESQHIQTKRECLERAQHALRSEEPEIDPAIELLERARTLMDSGDPEDIDLDILQQLRDAYYQKGDTAKAIEIEENLRMLRSVIQSRDFLALARYYKSIGGNYEWALEIAAKASPSNQYSEQAKAEQGPIQVAEGEIPSDMVTEEKTVDRSDLISKPSNEFTRDDCNRLLDWLEEELRALIVYSLSKLTPNWWKQRVPLDTRNNAEARKQEREKPYPGRAKLDRPLHEFLDFSDYIKIITMKQNWDEVFKAAFARQDLVAVKLNEIQVLRNDLRHGRDLPPEDREMFVINARQLLRAIQDYRGGMPDSASSESSKPLTGPRKPQTTPVQEMTEPHSKSIDAMGKPLGSIQPHVSIGLLSVIDNLKVIGDTESVDKLIEYLRDPDPNLRCSVVDALGAIGNPRAINPLIAILGDKNAKVRSHVVDALASIGEPAIKPLISVLQSQNTLVCQGTAEALGRIGDLRAVEPLIDLLRHPRKRVRLSAVVALGDIGDLRALSELERVAREDNNDDWSQSTQAPPETEMITIQPLTDQDESERISVNDAARQAIKKLKRKQHSSS